MYKLPHSSKKGCNHPRLSRFIEDLARDAMHLKTGWLKFGRWKMYGKALKAKEEHEEVNGKDAHRPFGEERERFTIQCGKRLSFQQMVLGE